jgi:hypothetical protein
LSVRRQWAQPLIHSTMLRRQRGQKIGEDSTGAPEVAVEDKHRKCNWPTEEDFTVTTDAFVSEKAMGATLDPFCHQRILLDACRNNIYQ